MAILLDVSNSMDGLISQAKIQLWNTVLTIGGLRCEGNAPAFEIAIYEYGRTVNDPKKGYVRQIMPFSRDLDLLNSKLNELTTRGGDEYCGQVIYSALDELQWDSSATTYKSIFIAGNESFFQGPVSYLTACELAINKGVIVNTIYCGSFINGLAENWDLGNRCGNGNFSYINQDATDFWVPTPYDTTLVVLKGEFNKTYIPYGASGQENYNNMLRSDTVAISTIDDPNIIEKYIVVKADPNLYNNSQWDLVNAYEKDSLVLEKIDLNMLDTALKNKNRAELLQYIIRVAAKRNEIRKTILENSEKQKSYIAEEKKKAGLLKEENTLGNQIQKTIAEQALRFNLKPETKRN